MNPGFSGQRIVKNSPLLFAFLLFDPVAIFVLVLKLFKQLKDKL